MNQIFDVKFNDESKKDFLTYSEEVLTERAVPSAEDGLLSSQRKLLWTMSEYLKMDNSSKTKKCASIVGSTLLTSYFHGDQACYGVLTKMAQPFLMRYPLVDGQGALGTQESNDMVASARYTEAKPSLYADLMLQDYKKHPVPTKRTYNDEFDEPIVLPSAFPNALCNGKQTIAIGLTHNSLPNNLTEVCNLLIAYLQNNDITLDEILKILPGPDFPNGNIVINKQDVREAFRTGKSNVSLKVRGDYKIKDNKIIFTSIPYRVYRNTIKDQLNKNIDIFEQVLEDYNDESNLGKTKLVFEIKKGVSLVTVLNKLFTYTDLQSTLSYNMNYIVNGTPKLCSIKELVEAYIAHQERVMINIALFDKDKAEKRIHILEGLLKAIDKIDEVIKLIKSSKDKAEARNKIISFLNVDDIQANAILDMKLSKLTHLDKYELENELKENQNIVIRCDKIISEKSFRSQCLIENITKLRDKYGDARRTQLLQLDEPKVEKEVIEVIPQECIVSITESNLIKKTPSTNYKTQKRGGVGVKNKDDIIAFTCRTNTQDNLMVFSSKGKMYKILVDKIPEKNTRIDSLINFDKDEKSIAYASLYKDSPAEFVFFATKQGYMKKVPITEFTKMKKGSGISAINFHEGDELAAVTFINNEDMLLITKLGMSIHIQSNFGAASRVAMGIKGISLREGDEVLVCLPIHKTTDELLVVDETGCGKRFELRELTLQNRGGVGLTISKTAIAGVCLVDNKDKVLITGNKNTICIDASSVPSVLTRTSMGNILIKNNRVMSVSKV